MRRADRSFTWKQEWVTSGPIPGPGTTLTMSRGSGIDLRRDSLRIGPERANQKEEMLAEHNDESVSERGSDMEVPAASAAWNDLEREVSVDAQSRNKRRKVTRNGKAKVSDDDDGWATDDSVVGRLLELKKEGAKRFLEELSKLEVKAEKAVDVREPQQHT